MKLWYALGIVLGLGSGGCATMTTGEAAVPLNAAGQKMPVNDSTLVIRSRELEDVSTSHLPVLEVSFENPTAKWYNIKSAQILVGNPERPGTVKFPQGQALRDWRLAVGQRKAVDDHNRDTATELGMAGALIIADVGSESKKKEVAIATSLIGFLAASAFLAAHYSHEKQEAERPPLLETNHLLSGPISVPPATIIKRWILLYTPYNASTEGLQLVLSYELAEQGTQRALLRTERPGSDSPRGSDLP